MATLTPDHSAATLFVYNGSGAFPGHAIAVVGALEEATGRLGRLVGAGDLQPKEWMGRAVCLAFSSGNVQDIQSALGEEAIRNIRDFVDGGGVVMGFGPGAALLATEREWQLGQEVLTGDGDLGFYQGKAIGPIDPLVDGKVQSVAHQVDTVASSLNLLVQGGFAFEGDEEAEVVATYHNRAAAIVHKKIHGGHLIASGPNLEVSVSTVWSINTDLAEQLDGNHEKARLALVKELCEKTGLVLTKKQALVG